MAQALEGVRVLDFTRNAPGMYASMILGDFGAEVIKIDEPPPTGRRATPRGARESVNLRERVDEAATPFLALERNKKSIVLDLKQEGARQVFHKLAQRADVVLEGYRPGVLKRLGVDYDTVSRLNPRIIYCSITGYGQDGPYVNQVGHSINYESFGGAIGLMGPKDGPPFIPFNFIGDYAGGSLHAAIGVLLALAARERTGRGQYVDIAMTDGVLSMLVQSMSDYFFSGIVPKRGENTLNGNAPFYHVYEAKDGKYISLGNLEPWFHEPLCKALGLEQYIPHQNATEKWPEMEAAFRRVFKTKTRDEWFHIMSRADICVGKVYSVDEIASDPHLRHRQMVIEREHPKAGKVKQVGFGIKLSDTPGSLRAFAPLKGQHTSELLVWLGYKAQDIEGLQAAGAVA